MSRFSHVTTCMEMSEKDVTAALESRDACKELLARFADIARPGAGAPRLLFLFARMAAVPCGWVEGDVRIKLELDGESTRIDSMSELAAGLRERLLPTVTVRAPFGEYLRAVERHPNAILPLTVKRKSWRRLVLVASEETRKTTMPPPLVEIAEDSLAHLPAPPTAPRVGVSPAGPDETDDDDVDAGWDAP